MNDSFTSIGLSGGWGERLAERGIHAPSPIQAVAIPELLRGGDAVIRSRTGTGKTLAYLLPVLERIDPSIDKLQAIVLAPTAELSMQILKVANELTAGSPLRAQALIGGASLQRQLDKLKLHPQLVVGTPGRIVELLELKKLKTTEVRFIVIDEADQTFALGAGGEAGRILASLPKRQQTVFCSATMPEAANKFVVKWTNNATWLEVESEGEGAAPRLPETVAHVLIIAEERDRIDTVRRFIRTMNPRAAILFVNQTDSIAEVESKLQHHGLAVEAIYGDQPKLERTAVMRKFRDGKLKLLLATDVAARGLDARDVTHVVHVDPPFDAEAYLHRAGRTGRMGHSGTSVLILSPKRQFIAKKFSEQLGIAFEEKRLQGGELTDRRPAVARTIKPNHRTTPETARTTQAEANGSPERKSARQRTAGAGVRAKAAPAPSAKKQASDRKRDTKNKGAPRWLKEKRSASGGDPGGGTPKG
jgi:ATP-dependent RNA helicase DeaD